MMRTNPPNPGRRAGQFRWPVALLLPLLLAVGCGDDDGGAPAPATATSTAVIRTSTPTVAPATSTPTVVASTSTPTVAPGTATPTPTMAQVALAACRKLSGCNQCFTTERGTCLEDGECARRLSEDEARCISAIGGCSPSGLGDCLLFGCGGGDGTGECE